METTGPDEQFECPHCKVNLRDRDLHTMVVEKCPACKNVVKASERWGYRNDEAIFRENCFAIDAWLAQVEGITAERVADGDGLGTMLWAISGVAFGGRCEIVCAKSSADFAVVRLCVDVESPDALPEKGKWLSKLNAYAVQAVGGTGTRTWWGAAQSFRIDQSLSPGLFDSVVDRLKAVTRQED